MYYSKFKIAEKKTGVDIMLVFSPLLYTSEPHLAVPHLTAYLKSKGYSIKAIDFNIEFFRIFKDKEFLEFLASLLEKRLYQLKCDGINSANYSSYLKINIALAAINSLTSDINSPLVYQEWGAFASRVLHIQAALGFNTLVYNDFKEFIDDYMCFQGVKDYPMDLRSGVARESTIAQVITKKMLADNKQNLFLSVFEYCLLEEIKKNKPKIIGLSIATNEQIIQALSIAQMVKNNMTDIHITAGGSYLSYLDRHEIKKLIELNVFDSIVMHEGEIPLEILINTIKGKKNLKDVPNLIYKEKDKIIYNPIVKPLALTDLPVPDYEAMPSLLTSGRSLSVYVSRGCYWGKCAYCSYTIPGEGRQSFSMKNSGNLLKELKYLSEKYKTKNFNLISESIPPVYAKEFSKMILNEGLTVELSIWARPEKQFTSELCSLMKKAGINIVTLGVESLNDKILKLMNKGITCEENLEAIRNMTKAGILVQINIIVGFPGETYEDALRTFKTLEKEFENKPIFRLVAGPFAILRGSLIQKAPDKFNVEILSEKNEEFRPKGIFINYRYLKGASFENMIKILSFYHKNLNREDKYFPYLPALASINSKAGWRYLDYTIKNNQIIRQPGYIFNNFSKNEVHYIDPELGYYLTANKNFIDVNQLIQKSTSSNNNLQEKYKTLAQLFFNGILLATQ